MPDFFPYIRRHGADKIFVYKNAGGENLSLGVYNPPDCVCIRPRPLFFFIHGGGWSSRKIFPDQKRWAGDYLGFLARYYADKGFLAVSVDYRLLRGQGQEEGYRLPDLVGDCTDALNFVRKRANEWGADFSRSVLLGESAGGYLAAAMTTFRHDFDGETEALILVNAVCDMTDPRWNKYLPDEERQSLHYSPLHQIGKNTPPVLLLHGADDSVVSPAHSLAFYECMRKQSRFAELYRIEKTDHAFLLAEFMLENGKSTAAAGLGVQIMNKFLRERFPELKL